MADKLPKPKPVNYILVDQEAEPEPYLILAEAREFHPETAEAQIGLAWRKNITANADGQILLGRCVKTSDLNREFLDYDFIIVLNREVWVEQEWDQAKKLALIDHELCHAAVAVDEDGEPKYNERGRPVFRCRKHDIEEFHEVVARHGVYKADLEVFAKTLGAEPSLFEAVADMIPAKGGIDSVTFSTPGREPVTLSREDVPKIREMAKTLRRKS